MTDSTIFVFRATEKFDDCKAKRDTRTSCTVDYSPVYFVNIEVWVEAENALEKVTSDHINFDPVDKGSYKPKFENLLEYTVVYKLVLSLINVETSIYFIILMTFTNSLYQQH